MLKLRSVFWVGICVPLLVACGDDASSDASGTTSSENGSGGGGATASSVGGGGTSSVGGSNQGGDGPQCPAPEPAHVGDTGVVMDSISANYIDQDGTAADGVNTTICGTNICSESVLSGADGSVTVAAGGTAFDYPRFNSGHDGRAYAKLSGVIPGAPTHNFGTVRVMRLPAFSDGVEIAPGASATQGGVTLTVEAGAAVDHDKIAYADGERGLRAVIYDIGDVDTAELPGVDASKNIEVLIGVSPVGTHICPGAAMSFTNVAEWPAGSDVEILLNGAKAYSHYVPYGGWDVIADAVVSDDGATVTTKDGQTIETLATFGARLK